MITSRFSASKTRWPSDARCELRSLANKRSIRAQAQAFFPRPLKAVIFDCDGVILESEDLHRRAYNAAFENFRVQCSNSPVVWTEEFYDVLQNTVGGGKPKMRWYFGKEGWPTSDIVPGTPTTEEDQAKVIDTLQDWKSEKYQSLIGSGDVPPRPGVLRLMDSARDAGLKVAVCSAATKGSVEFTLNSLLGPERFRSLDCFLAGDDVPRKKPDPVIYQIAAERLQVEPAECVVIEDSSIGLQAATGAGMRCVVTYTPSTRAEPFREAEIVVSDLGDAEATVTVSQLMVGSLRSDDRLWGDEKCD